MFPTRPRLPTRTDGPRARVTAARRRPLAAIAATSTMLAAAALAAGCASSTPPRYYRLEPVAVAAAAAASDRAVVVGPFLVADYLDRPQFVTRGAGGEVIVPDGERWAEPLESGFQSALTANVARLLGSERVLEFPAQAILKPDSRVTGRVSRLDVDSTGLAVLEVQWGVIGRDGGVADSGRRSRYEAQAAGAGGYAARVAALNAVIASFSADVAAAVR
jgi:uncharacterized lipoprotein YmbA